jgi:hypothetical protein
MSDLKYSFLALASLMILASCSNKNSRNYQYMPNMYISVGYETYQEVAFLPSHMEAGLPAENTIHRGWLPYEFENSLEEKELARVQLSPILDMEIDQKISEGKALYEVYCAVCHGTKGDGNGILVSREKILGVPSYADAARNITEGSTYHTIYYGLNSMGSYAGQLNFEERWKVSEYVIKLKQELTK